MKRSLAIALAVVASGVGEARAWAECVECVRCTRIREGVLQYEPSHYLAGTPYTLGVNPFGYDYENHVFDGFYVNAYLGADGFPPYEGDEQAYLAANPKVAGTWYWEYRRAHLMMKWNDAWLANCDCDGDRKLDRHFGYDSYVGSPAQIWNEMDQDEGARIWKYENKIVAVPEDARLAGGVWYTADGRRLGPEIWGDFAIVREHEKVIPTGGCSCTTTPAQALAGWGLLVAAGYALRRRGRRPAAAK